MSYYKFLTADNLGEYSGFDYLPYLPHDGQPGEWLPEIPAADLKMCERGYHACDAMHLLDWINSQLFEVELAGDQIIHADKTAAQRMRIVRKIDAWNDKTARLFAVWCAREALKLVANPDPRSIAACEVAERYANGQATDNELSAASAAARAAWHAASAGWHAAWDAAWHAAWHAARDARHAAREAAGEAAGAAVRDAQSRKLIELLGLEE